MTKPTPNRHDTGNPSWVKPELRRLGTMRDIAQPGPGTNQGASGKGVPIAS